MNLKDWDALFVSDQLDETAPDTSEPKAEQPVKSDKTEIVAAQGKTTPMPVGVDIVDSVPVSDVSPWSYYISNVRYDGQEFVMIWRDTPKGDAEWICNVAQTGQDTSLRHTVEYAEESYERSGEKSICISR